LHDGNPLLRWQAGNATIRRDPAGNIKPDKEKARHRIDGIVAAIMAVGRASVQSVTPGSVYETRGVRWV
jgi:phage terminase large subunit-like protein